MPHGQLQKITADESPAREIACKQAQDGPAELKRRDRSKILGTPLVGQGLEIEVFDQHHLIALFVVDELIDQPLREQDSKATGSHALRFTVLDVAHRIVCWIRYGSVGDLVQSKAFTRVADAAL